MQKHKAWKVPEDTQVLNLMYTLDRLSPCLDLQLLEVLVEYDWMNYFDMKWILGDLCRRGLCTSEPKGAGVIYTLTESGKSTLDLFENRVLKSVRDKITEEAPEWRRQFDDENHATVQITQTERGEFVTQMKLADLKMDLMTVSLTVSSPEMANRMSKNWKVKADEICDYIIRRLTEEEA